MKQMRLELLIAAALLSASLVFSAYLISPPRYATVGSYQLDFVIADRRSGELFTCGLHTGCRRLWSPADLREDDELDNAMREVAAEIENSN